MTAKKKPAPRTENIGIKLSVDLPTVETASDTVLSILASGAEQETLREALRSFTLLCGINHASISNCHVEMGKD